MRRSRRWRAVRRQAMSGALRGDRGTGCGGGRWRVLLDIYEDARTIHVTQVGPRGDIYKK